MTNNVIYFVEGSYSIKDVLLESIFETLNLNEKFNFTKSCEYDFLIWDYGVIVHNIKNLNSLFIEDFFSLLDESDNSDSFIIKKEYVKNNGIYFACNVSEYKDMKTDILEFILYTA